MGPAEVMELILSAQILWLSSPLYHKLPKLQVADLEPQVPQDEILKRKK